MKRGIMVLLVLLMFLVSCTTVKDYKIKEDKNPTASNESFLENTSKFNNPISNKELPECPSETATGCRKTKDRNHSDCNGSGTVKLTTPMRLEDIGIIIPMGAMVGGHVTPIDHMYFQPTVFQSQPDTYEVVADAGGIITDIGHESKGDNRYNKYRLVIKHSCDFYSIYNLLTSLSPKIIEKIGNLDYGSNARANIFIKEGEVIGRIGGQTLDLSVNYDKVNINFIVPEHYQGEDWKIHTVDPFDYFKEPIRSQLLAKNVRRVVPFGGKIDYDIDGKLVGNWFVENSGGYAGSDHGRFGYWSTHLAIVYDTIDPSHIIFSIGNFDGEPKQFSVKGNSPDPKDIDLSSGLVKYGLVDTQYVLGNGDFWNRMSYADNVKAIGGDQVKGVVLLQLIDKRKLKVEVFHNKNLEDVSSFTDKAVIYER